MLVFLCFLLINTHLCFSQSNTSAEKIQSFNSKIEVNKDGTIDIKETIIYDFGNLQRHGIYREIPYIKENLDGKKYVLDFKIESVKDEKGNPYNYSVSKENFNYKIKIGDPKRTITGINTYIISYNVSGAISYFPNFDELYWNITGDKWKVPILAVSSQISFPQDIEATKLKHSCYTGAYGSNESICSLNYDQGTLIVNSLRTLNSSEGLTVAVGFPKHIVNIIEPKEYVSFWQTIFGKILFFFFILLFIFWYIVYPIYVIYRWFRYGRDPSATTGQVRAWYDPPQAKSGRDLTPEEVGSVIDETVNLRDISSMIVDLAKRGYFKIEEKKRGDFYFHKIRDFSKDKKLLLFEKELLNGIFESGSDIRLKDQYLFQSLANVKNQIYKDLVDEDIFPKNPQKIRNFYIFIGVLAAVTINIPLAIISFIFGKIMPRKTEFGASVSNIAKSLKNFLSSQERQLEYQAKNQMFFEKLLPYAVAFGVEKIWAKRFKDIQMTPPKWYSSYSDSFNSAILVSSLNSSFKSVSASSSVSSSGFGSGSSGGGFSGGGGGGGGGGSW